MSSDDSPRHGHSTLGQAFRLSYAALGYLAGLVAIAYLVAFLPGWLVPKGIDDGAVGNPWLGVLADVGLVLAFGMHHSITARPWFKRWWTRWVPQALERSTYLFMTAALTGALVVLYRPVPITLWHIQTPALVYGIHAAYLMAYAMMFAATFHFGHLRFFGLGEVLERFLNKPAAPPSFTARYLYAIVRHPISLGWMITPLVTPHMTVGRLAWFLGVLAYILVATKFEEQDLVDELGERYLSYREEVPAFVPRPRSPRSAEPRRA